MNFIIQSLSEAWNVLVESAPYVFLGFGIAGLLKAFVPENLARSHMGGKGVWPVVKAALLGMPIPLCSCGVIPAAAGLRQAGASKGAATAFLISTPETGVDSILVNYALLDPVMTVVRPLAALVTGSVAGVLVNRFDPQEPEASPVHGALLEPLRQTVAAQQTPTPRQAPVALQTRQTPAASQAERAVGCGCSGGCQTAAKPQVRGLWARFKAGQAYAFGEMLPDVGLWLLIGVGLAGIIGAALPQDGLERYIGTGFGSMLAMLAVGMPLYVCATASTPIAAALALHGLTPGAALVFLLAGPATNAASITVVWRMFGPRATLIYLASIAGCSLAFGLAVNWLYQGLGLGVSGWAAGGREEAASALSALCALTLVGLVFWRRFGRRRR